MENTNIQVLFLFEFLMIWASAGRYEANWASLDSRPIPEWYDDAKFGIFIHWGVYSVPSWAPVGTYAEWYWNNLAQGPGNPTYEFHVKTYGKNFQYTDFAPMFTAELWNPEYWADLFVLSGAQYVVPTSKHHEGYCLWPSSQSWNWNSVDVGPQRDLLKELFSALRNRGLHASMYYSLYEWFNPMYKGPHPHQYVEQIMLPQLYDLVTNYQPELIFSDGDWEYSSAFWNSTEFLAWLYNDSPVKDIIVVDDRWGNDTRNVHGGYFSPEYSSDVWLDHKWEENSGMDVFSYGYNRNSQAGNYSTVEKLLHLLIRTVAFGGNLLLDIGPAFDGQIPVIMQERLLSMGDWLSVNGEAIYKTRIWNVQSEPDNITFYTQNAQLDSVYAITTSWPTDHQLILSLPVPSANTEITLLGYDKPLRYRYDTDKGLIIDMPLLSVAEMPCFHAWSLKMTSLSAMPETSPIHSWWSISKHDHASCAGSQCNVYRLSKSREECDYERVRIEGLLLDNPILEDNDSSTVPLILYYSSIYEDFASVTDDVFLDSTYHALSGIEGFLFKRKVKGSVPLDLWWSPKYHDFFLLGSLASAQEAAKLGYHFIGTQGYVYPGPHYESSTVRKI